MLKLKNNKDLWDESKSWTTDAPYRETQSAIKKMKIKKVTCVEMESSALYAFAKAKNKDDPAKVKATGKPNNKNNKVVKNIITANTSGVI